MNVKSRVMLSVELDADKICLLIERVEWVQIVANNIHLHVEPLNTQGKCVLTLEGEVDIVTHRMRLLEKKYKEIFE